MCLKHNLCLLLILINLALKTESKFEFSNFICTSFDKKFGEFEYCYLKSINRSYKYISGKFKIYQLPITELKVNGALWKRFNGYKPFLYNLTFEACAFFRNPKSNPVAKFVYDTQRIYSNLNHSCPLNHDITLEKLPVDFVNDRLTKVLPAPKGDYLFKLNWLISEFRTASAEIYGTLS